MLTLCSSGMRRISYSSESGVQVDRKPWCLHLFCQVIVCIWGFLLQQLMQLLPTVDLPYFLTQGLKFLWIRILDLLVYMFLHYKLDYLSELALQSLSYHSLNTWRLSTILVFLLVCALGCCLKRKNQVFVGRFRMLDLYPLCVSF